MFLVGALAQMWKISEVDFGFKGHLQDKPMQEIQETMDNGRRKVRMSLGSSIIN